MNKYLQENTREKNARYIIAMASLLVLFSVVFAFMVYRLHINELKNFDYSIIKFIQSRISEQLTSVMKIITFFGGQLGLVLADSISSIILFFFKKRYAVYIILSSIAGLVLNLLLKGFFERERPVFYRLIEENGYSFPSGHSMSAMIFYISLAVILAKISKSKMVDIIIGILFAILIILIGISRIYLGVHYPSDVLAGFAAGGFVVCICSIALNYYEFRRRIS